MNTKNNPLFESSPQPSPRLRCGPAMPPPPSGLASGCFWRGGGITGVITRHQHPSQLLSYRHFS